MSRQDQPRAAKKPTPFLSRAGSTRNIGSVGNMNQKVDCDSAAIPSGSDVSRHSQMKARMETSGQRQDQRAERRGLLGNLRDGGDDEAREQRLGGEVEHGSLLDAAEIRPISI